MSQKDIVENKDYTPTLVPQLPDDKKKELADFCLHLHQTMQELQAGDVLHQELTQIQLELLAQIDRLND